MFDLDGKLNEFLLQQKPLRLLVWWGLKRDRMEHLLVTMWNEHGVGFFFTIHSINVFCEDKKERDSFSICRRLYRYVVAMKFRKFLLLNKMFIFSRKCAMKNIYNQITNLILCFELNVLFDKHKNNLFEIQSVLIYDQITYDNELNNIYMYICLSEMTFRRMMIIEKFSNCNAKSKLNL